MLQEKAPKKQGLRTQKKVGSTTYNYYYADGLLIRQTWGSNYIDFLYDESGSAYSFIYNGTQYYYVRNLQGDVVRILNTSGTTVVAYSYDAWGKCTVTSGASNAIANANPIRYRGYYYDTDTGFYYLQSRYYDPVVKRFISADGAISGVGGELLGYNQYAYCFNNPVNSSDSSGNWPRWITATVAVAAVALGVAALATGNLALAATAGKVAVVATSVYAAQTLHYDLRQAQNVNLPRTPQEADGLDWVNSESISPQNPNGGGPAADCHQYTSPDKTNVKYVSPDGHREVIFNSADQVVTDPRDIGTYNVCPSSELWYSKESIGHLGADIIPWVIFGNSDEDWGPIINEIIRFFE